MWHVCESTLTSALKSFTSPATLTEGLGRLQKDSFPERGVGAGEYLKPAGPEFVINRLYFYLLNEQDSAWLVKLLDATADSRRSLTSRLSASTSWKNKRVTHRDVFPEFEEMKRECRSQKDSLRCTERRQFCLCKIKFNFPFTHNYKRSRITSFL